MPMDIDLIHRKLDSLGRCIHRIEIKRPATLDSLIDGVDLQPLDLDFLATATTQLRLENEWQEAQSLATQ